MHLDHQPTQATIFHVITASLATPQVPLEEHSLWGSQCVDILIYHANRRNECAYVDRLLDLKQAMILPSSQASEVLRRFYLVWRNDASRDYAMLFKLRRWFEQRIEVHRSRQSTSRPSHARIKIGYRSFDSLVRALQNEWFQQDLSIRSLEEVVVSFAWISPPKAS